MSTRRLIKRSPLKHRPIEVYVNNEKQVLRRGDTIADLVAALYLQATKGVALAVNEKVIPCEKWGEHHLEDRDSVLLITATQGG